jgi:hypothetical protein
MKVVDFRHLTQQQEIYLAAAIVLAIIAIVVAIVLVRRWRRGTPRESPLTVDDRPVDLSSRLGKLIDGITPSQAESNTATQEEASAHYDSRADVAEVPSLEPAVSTAVLGASASPLLEQGTALGGAPLAASTSVAMDWPATTLPATTSQRATRRNWGPSPASTNRRATRRRWGPSIASANQRAARRRWGPLVASQT